MRAVWDEGVIQSYQLNFIVAHFDVYNVIHIPHSSPFSVTSTPVRLGITTLSEVVVALTIVSDHRAVLSATVVITDATNDDSISPRASSAISTSTLDWEFKVWSRAAEFKALVILVLMGVVVGPHGLAVGVVR